MKLDTVNLPDISKPKRPVWMIVVGLTHADDPYLHNYDNADGIPWHFFISRNGTIIEGRHIEDEAWADDGIVNIGVQGTQLPNDEQIHSIRALCWVVQNNHYNSLTVVNADDAYDLKGFVK